MKISKLCKYAVVPAAILILSQTGIGKAVADTLTPAAVSSRLQLARPHKKGRPHQLLRRQLRLKAAWFQAMAGRLFLASPGFLVNLGFPASLAFLANLGFLAFQETVRGQRQRLRQPLPLLRQPPLRLPQRLLPQLQPRQ